MSVIRAVLSLALVSCGGILPFFGDDDDAPPSEPASADDASARDATGEGGPSEDGGEDGGAPDSSGTCVPVTIACKVASDCCKGLSCEKKCCIPDGQPSTDATLCCSGDVDFANAAGSICRPRS